MRKLGYGLSNAVPDTATAAWGARLIINMDGGVDFVYDRTDMVGVDPAAERAFRNVLKEKLSYGVLRDAIRDLILTREIDTRVEREVVILDENGIKVVGNTNASHGYLYIAAWETADDDYTIVEVDGVKIAETRRFTLGADS